MSWSRWRLAKLLVLQKQSTLYYVPKRHLTKVQVSTALRPFYFLVHPDLFARWPQQQLVNESSLKLLQSYLNTMVDEKRRPTAIKTTFYVKPRIYQNKELRKIHIRLSQSQLRKTVSHILTAVDLPTSYVDNIPDTEVDLTNASHVVVDDDDDEEQVLKQPSLDLLHPTDIRRPLKRWLTDNVEVARDRMAKVIPIRLQTERLQDQLCHELGIVDILWDCGWDTTHKRGVLDSFSSLKDQYRAEIEPVLYNRTVVFGSESGMSLDGQVILYTGEVRHNWLNVIKRIPETEEALAKIPLVEKALSQTLRDIQIVRRRNQPIKLVENYKRQLLTVVTSMADYLSKQSLPLDWPESLNTFQLCVDNESSPLTVTSSGQFIVPASCPGFLLVSFILEHMDEAREKLSKAEGDRMQEEILVRRCIKELGLIQLDRDESLDSSTMKVCCQRLLETAPTIRHLTHGNHFVVSRYYAVNYDGVICIPWNWKEIFE